jgi:hypothetical protein
MKQGKAGFRPEPRPSLLSLEAVQGWLLVAPALVLLVAFTH